MATVQKLHAVEILDSRGRPTVWVACTLADGTTASASVPSGASTGAAEAHELRDGDPARYGGLGVGRAVAGVNGEIFETVEGRYFTDVTSFDRILIDLDGTPNKARLGANALLACSLAFARACAAADGVALYTYLGALVGHTPTYLPRPMINLFSGGRHAGGQVAVQDVLVVSRAATLRDTLAQTYAVYQAAVALTAEQYGMRPLTADEGGLAPAFAHSEAMLAAAVASIVRAGYVPGEQIALAVDVAASHFNTDGGYALDGERLDSAGMVERLAAWVARYPLVSIEDGLAQDDWDGWAALRGRIGAQALVVGDDLLCTNAGRIHEAVTRGLADALLLKPNQIGTLSEAAAALGAARAAGWSVVVSARSGETEDDWLADLAVGWGADYLKVGSITQSERLAKYNRLLRIEDATGWTC